MWNLKSDTNELIYKTESDSQTQRTNLWLPQRRVGGRDRLGFWIDMYTLLFKIFKIDNQQGPVGTAQGMLLNIL